MPHKIISKLAANGGPLTRVEPMPIRKSLGLSERRLIDECLDYYDRIGQDPGYQGEYERRYCQEFVKHMGGGFADAVSSGTAALFVAISALQLPKGSRVLVSPITDPGTINAIILNGLVPKLIDSKPGSYNSCAEQLAARFDDRVKAVLVVHSIGEPAEIDRMVDWAHSVHLPVIEDCSQSHGALVSGKQVGTFGDIAAFSTMYRKGHTTGPCGGVVYTKNVDLYNLVCAYADRGKPRWRVDFNDRDPSGYLFPALNFHSNEIACAIGIASLNRLNDVNEKRRNFIYHLKDHLKSSQLFSLYEFNDSFAPFIFPIISKFGSTQEKIKVANLVLSEGIPLNPHYNYFVKDWPWVQSYLDDSFEPLNAKKIRDDSFCIYLNENYGIQEAKDVTDALYKVEFYLKNSQ